MSSSLEEKIHTLEFEVESLKARLADDTKLNELVRRIAACESLAGIQDIKYEAYIKDEENN